MREFEDKPTGFQLFESNAAGEAVQSRNGEHGTGLGEDEVLELEDFADFLLHFHVIVESVVANSLLLLGYRGGLGHGSPLENFADNRERFEGSGFRFQEFSRVSQERLHFGFLT